MPASTSLSGCPIRTPVAFCSCRQLPAIEPEYIEIDSWNVIGSLHIAVFRQFVTVCNASCPALTLESLSRQRVPSRQALMNGGQHNLTNDFKRLFLCSRRWAA